MKIFVTLESAVEKAIFRRIAALSPPEMDQYFEDRKELWEASSRFEFIIGAVERIYGNIGSLLTHISAMIAALSIILIVFQDYRMTQIFIFCEMIVYTILAIYCVYCLKFRGKVPIKELYMSKSRTEGLYNLYLYSRYIYSSCLSGVLFNTILFVITIFVHVMTLIQ